MDAAASRKGKCHADDAATSAWIEGWPTLPWLRPTDVPDPAETQAQPTLATLKHRGTEAAVHNDFGISMAARGGLVACRQAAVRSSKR
jgi:hypothetical protein